LLKTGSKIALGQQVLICGGLDVDTHRIAIWQQPPLEM